MNNLLFIYFSDQFFENESNDDSSDSDYEMAINLTTNLLLIGKVGVSFFIIDL